MCRQPTACSTACSTSPPEKPRWATRQQPGTERKIRILAWRQQRYGRLGITIFHPGDARIDSQDTIRIPLFAGHNGDLRLQPCEGPGGRRQGWLIADERAWRRSHPGRKASWLIPPARWEVPSRITRNRRRRGRKKSVRWLLISEWKNPVVVQFEKLKAGGGHDGYDKISRF